MDKQPIRQPHAKVRAESAKAPPTLRDLDIVLRKDSNAGALVMSMDSKHK
jgi:hypothetical protein